MADKTIVSPANGKTKGDEFFVSSVNGEKFNSLEELQEHYAGYIRLQANQAVVTLEFQRYIPSVPNGKKELKKTYSANDDITVESWWDDWVEKKKINIKEFDVNSMSVISEHGKFAYRPCIIAGSGPSLKRNAKYLKERNGIGLVSCLHNFGYFEDMGVKPDYYLNLDAGDVTIPEMAQGGKSDPEKYWEATKNHTLVSALHCHPELHKKWRGKLLFYDTALNGMNEAAGLKDWKLFFQTGGNTLGACHYMAKGILGSSPIIFVGADFAFGYEKKFHPFDSPYDKKFSGIVPCTDVWGNRVYTWPSYYGFKCWFEHVAMGGHGDTPGSYINCTEGGILGSYSDGNILQIRQRCLKDVLGEYNLHKILPDLLKKDRPMLLY